MIRALLLPAALVAALASASCQDPVHDNEVAALGGEAPGVPPGPLHRPGQPCLVCHGGEGPGSPQFSVAGTVFQLPGTTTGANGVSVKITDVNKVTAMATTNTAGNFFILASEYSPAWPFDAELDVGAYRNPMVEHIGRAGSCATCHFDPPGASSPGHVFLAGDPGDLPDAGGQ